MYVLLFGATLLSKKGGWVNSLSFCFLLLFCFALFCCCFVCLFVCLFLLFCCFFLLGFCSFLLSFRFCFLHLCVFFFYVVFVTLFGSEPGWEFIWRPDIYMSNEIPSGLLDFIPTDYIQHLICMSCYGVFKCYSPCNFRLSHKK
jgi:hypothetical protein